MKGMKSIADPPLKGVLGYHSVNVRAWCCSGHLFAKTTFKLDTHHLQHLEISFEFNFPAGELNTSCFAFVLISSPLRLAVKI